MNQILLKQILKKPSYPANNEGFDDDDASVVAVCGFNSCASSTPNYFGAKVNSSSEHLSCFKPFPRLRDVRDSEKQGLFIEKLSMCCSLFDFRDPKKGLTEKETKRQTLLELHDSVAQPDWWFSDDVLQKMGEMLTVNLFGGLVSRESAWSHLEIVYAILESCLNHPQINVKLVEGFIDRRCIIRLFYLFYSDDKREKRCLARIIYLIYDMHRSHRPFIRKEIYNILWDFVFLEEEHNGIAYLLVLLESLIKRSQSPLERDDILLLVQVLIPLHKPACVATYHKQLCYCITEFLKKERKLADTIVRGLLEHWPRTNCCDEVLFLAELEQVLEGTANAEFQRCMVPLFHQLAGCVGSFDCQVANSALLLLTDVHIKKLITENYKALLPIIFPALERNARNHQNPDIRDLSRTLWRFFFDCDIELLERVVRRSSEHEAEKNKNKLRCKGDWNHGLKFAHLRRLTLVREDEGILLVDGAFSDSDHIAGIGWILLDSSGKIIHAASTPIRAASSLETDAKAILAAVSAAKQASLEKIYIFSDCLQVVDIANRLDIGPSHIFDLFVRFWSSVDSSRFCINHCDRDLTAGANWLAAKACKTGASNWWEGGIPKFLMELVRELF